MYWQRPTPDRSGHHSFQQGFTLIEGLVVALIIGIAAAIAIPNLQRVRIKTETQAAVYKIAGHVDLARSEAIKRHVPVGVIYGNDNFFRIYQDWAPIAEDWTPAEAPLATDGNSINDYDEEEFRKELLSSNLRLLTTPPAGDLDPKTPLLLVGGGIYYNSDGSLKSNAGAAYFTDTVGNVFRLRINAVTGAPRIEKYLSNNLWSPKKED